MRWNKTFARDSTLTAPEMLQCPYSADRGLELLAGNKRKAIVPLPGARDRGAGVPAPEVNNRTGQPVDLDPGCIKIGANEGIIWRFTLALRTRPGSAEVDRDRSVHESFSA